jgi:hypothetical protein
VDCKRGKLRSHALMQVRSDISAEAAAAVRAEAEANAHKQLEVGRGCTCWHVLCFSGSLHAQNRSPVSGAKHVPLS